MISICWRDMSSFDSTRSALCPACRRPFRQCSWNMTSKSTGLRAQHPAKCPENVIANRVHLPQDSFIRPSPAGGRAAATVNSQTLKAKESRSIQPMMFPDLHENATCRSINLVESPLFGSSKRSVSAAKISLIGSAADSWFGRDKTLTKQGICVWGSMGDKTRRQRAQREWEEEKKKTHREICAWCLPKVQCVSEDLSEASGSGWASGMCMLLVDES